VDKVQGVGDRVEHDAGAAEGAGALGDGTGEAGLAAGERSRVRRADRGDGGRAGGEHRDRLGDGGCHGCEMTTVQ